MALALKEIAHLAEDANKKADNILLHLAKREDTSDQVHKESNETAEGQTEPELIRKISAKEYDGRAKGNM